VISKRKRDLKRKGRKARGVHWQWEVSMVEKKAREQVSNQDERNKIEERREAKKQKHKKGLER
jgi:hypothetical protein